jgi:hypothetical protein
MKNIDLGIRLPESVLEDVTAIVGRRGRGKTNTATVMVEEAHAAGMRFCVADPVGVWWGLRSSRDGKAAGIPVVVMGGEHAMVPLEPTAGKILADFMAAPGPSVVLDFRLMRKGEITRFMADFLERLYFKNRESLLLVLDEADKFAPQRPFGEEARMLGAAEDVVKMGRARGLHSVLITQRPATLNKNVITQAGMLIAHGLPAPQDQKAIDAWIQERAEEEHRKEFQSTLGGLEKGEAWIWAPELAVFQRAQIRERKTFDSSATPKRGERRVAPKVLAEVDLEKLSAEIKATAERAKATDPKALQARIAELERAAKAASPAAAAAPKPKPSVTDAQIKRVEAAIDRLRDGAAGLLKAQAHQIDKLSQRMQVVVTEAGLLRDQLKAAGVTPSVRGGTVGAGAPPTGRPGVVGVGRPAVPSRPAPVVSGDGRLPAGERAILTAAAQYRAGVTREQLSILTGYKRSSRDTYLQRLRQAGLVAEERGVILATADGVAALGDFEPLPTGDALREYWLDRLPEGEGRILGCLVQAYPRAVERDAIDEATGYKRSSRDTYLQRLSARRLIRIDGRGVRASEELFS